MKRILVVALVQFAMGRSGITPAVAGCDERVVFIGRDMSRVGVESQFTLVRRT